MAKIEGSIEPTILGRSSTPGCSLSFPSNEVKLGSFTPSLHQRTSYLLSPEDKHFIADLKKCVHTTLYGPQLSSEDRDFILSKRKVVGDNILPFFKSKFESILKPVAEISSTTTPNQCIETIMGKPIEATESYISDINESFNDRFILLDLVSFLIKSGHKYAGLIREESSISDSLAIVDLVGKDSENSWRTLFILFLFDLFFDEEEVEPSGTLSKVPTSNSVLSQIINRWSSVDETLFKGFFNLSPTFDANILESLKFNLQLERLYLLEIVFQCSSYLVPLNVKEWDLLFSAISASFSFGQNENNSNFVGILLFSIINGLSFHSTQKPMYDLVRSRLPQRQDYFSTKESWMLWCAKMEEWISHHLWTDPLVKYSLSLSWGIFLRMSREVRMLRGGFPPSNESASNFNAVDIEITVSDSWAFNGIQCEKNHLVLAPAKSIFSIFSERFLPSSPQSSLLSPWGEYITFPSKASAIFSKWESYICESLLQLCTSILTWGSIDWIRGMQNYPSSCNMASFCDLIGNLFYYPGLPIQSAFEKRRPHLSEDASVAFFWESEKGTFFIRMALSSIGSASTPEISISAIRMLNGLAQGPIAAMFAFDILKGSLDMFTPILTWTHLFHSLERYQIALALDSGFIYLL